MSHPINKIYGDVETLVGDTGALLDSAASSAADAVGKSYGDARRSVSNVLERGKDMYGIAYKKAVKNTMAVDAVIHENLYRTVLVGAGIGMILGYLLAHRCASRDD